MEYNDSVRNWEKKTIMKQKKQGCSTDDIARTMEISTEEVEVILVEGNLERLIAEKNKNAS